MYIGLICAIGYGEDGSIEVVGKLTVLVSGNVRL